jgi:hypothetical protein
MSLPIQIKNGIGTGHLAEVTEQHALKVTGINSSSSSQSSTELTLFKQLREFFTELGGASDDLNIDGSTTSKEFTIEAETGKTKWVTGVRILLYDTEMELDTNDFRRFGSATAVSTPLTNGIEFYATQGGIQTNYFVDPITTIGDFMNYADKYTNFINAVSNQDDFLSFDFNFDVPIVLPEGSSDKLSITINDDLTDVFFFKSIARGYQELI